jgi:hypothetical protein
MKANKALKRLAKIEALMSDVSERYSPGASHIREALQDAMGALARVKAAVSSQASSGRAKHLPGKRKRAAVIATAAAAPVNVAASAPARRKRRFSAAQRKQQAQRMKAYWAAKKKAAAKPQPKAAARKAKKTAPAA